MLTRRPAPFLVATFSFVLSLSKRIPKNLPAAALGLFLCMPSTLINNRRTKAAHTRVLSQNILPTETVVNNGTEEMRRSIKTGQVFHADQVARVKNYCAKITWEGTFLKKKMNLRTDSYNLLRETCKHFEIIL